ncbi:MAG: DEAD/DEAH box helicase, partial [Verrucomicrobiota bacterium]
MGGNLPIVELRASLEKSLVGDCARIVVEAPTGSGKSTQIPQYLADSETIGDGEIIVLQPRRLAARMLATRVAKERRGKLGDEVGFQVRFENRSSARTRIRFITEGILIRWLISNPNLEGIAAVVLDEFHERHFFGDISLARALEVQETSRPDLKLVVMSATLEIDALIRYLGPTARHLQSEGRTFPVETRYHPARERHRDEVWDLTARALRAQLNESDPGGHVLVFMPGRFEIRK